MTVVWEANNVPKFYINGAQVPTVGTATIPSIFNNVGAPLDIGRSTYTTDRYFKGTLDEVSLSSVSRTASYISTSFNNQQNPTAFSALGAEETLETSYTLTVTLDGSGSVTKNPDETFYPSGTVVSLTAVPADGWVFTGWSGDLSGVANPATVTMDSNKDITQQSLLRINTL